MQAMKSGTSMDKEPIVTVPMTTPRYYKDHLSEFLRGWRFKVFLLGEYKLRRTFFVVTQFLVTSLNLITLGLFSDQFIRLAEWLTIKLEIWRNHIEQVKATVFLQDLNLILNHVYAKEQEGTLEPEVLERFKVFGGWPRIQKHIAILNTAYEARQYGRVYQELNWIDDQLFRPAPLPLAEPNKSEVP